MNAIDTNVLVYAVDASQPVKASIARSLLVDLENDATPLVLPWQAAVEFLACLARWEQRRKIDRGDSRRYLDQFVLRCGVVMPSVHILHAALDLRDRYSLSHWDSTLLAACAEAGVTTLFSEDLTDGELYGSVTVRNPFRDLT